jgi:hypothetical protein
LTEATYAQTAPGGFAGATVEAWPMTDAITSSNIRLWCEVLEDANPIYYDEAFARATRYGAIIAPPTMAMIWTWRPEWAPSGPVWNVADEFASFLPDYPSLVSVRSVQTHSRPLKLGERLTVVRYVNTPLPEQDTERGRGRPAVRYFSLRDEAGHEVVSYVQHGVHLARKADSARPVPAVEDEVLARRPRLADPDAVSSFDLATLRPGQRLPAFTMPITYKRCIKWVGASRDFFEGHHDREYARARGAPDLYLGVHFFHGLFGRYATDWAGPYAVVAGMDFRSRGRCFPGEVIAVNGEVTGLRSEADASFADLAVECGTKRGLLYDADITVRLR